MFVRASTLELGHREAAPDVAAGLSCEEAVELPLNE